VGGFRVGGGVVLKSGLFNRPATWAALLALAGAATILLVGLQVKAPGYMDADYYYANAIQLAEGHDFYQPFLWTYLDDPLGLPHPSFTFWMPLVSLLGAAGYAVFHSFVGARLWLWAAAAAVPATTFWLGLDMHGRLRPAVLGGLFALFPAYYLVHMAPLDGFAVYMLLGSAFLACATRWARGTPLAAVGMGLLTGLLHLTRADGILWLAGGVAWLAWSAWHNCHRPLVGFSWPVWAGLGLGLLLGGYLTVTFPWYLRNALTFGSLFPPGGSRALWLTRYEDLFLYPASGLTFSRWAQTGLDAILLGWGQALWSNLQTALAVQGSIVLTPFILAGAWTLRHQSAVQLGTGMGLLTGLAFTVVFPYQGINGSFFHSGAALQPLLWALAPIGLEALVARAARWRGWMRAAQVERYLATLLVLACLGLTSLLAIQHLVVGGWNNAGKAYAHAEQALTDLGATPCEVVMVNNPPGYYLASGRYGIAIPAGDKAMVLAAAHRYGAQYLLLDSSNGASLPAYYLNPHSDADLTYLVSVEGMRLYEINR
jgi:hypothetical protein